MVWLYLYLCFIASCPFHANTQLQMTIVILLSSGKISLKWCPSATGVCILIHITCISVCVSIYGQDERRGQYLSQSSITVRICRLVSSNTRLDLTSDTTTVAYHIFPLSDGNSRCLQISRGKHFLRICLHPTPHLLPPTRSPISITFRPHAQLLSHMT
jgi:hypothetical protein